MQRTHRGLTPITVRAAGKESAEVLIYDEIGPSFWTDEAVTAKQFAKDLRAIGPIANLDVRINSPGGNVFEGFAIYNTLKNNGAKIRVHVDGMALSIAHVISMVGDEINIAENGVMMMHDAQGLAVGTASDMRKAADLLDLVGGQIAGVYSARTAIPLDQIVALMAAETWMTGDEAKAKGFATAVTPNKQLTNFFHVPTADYAARFRNVPGWLRAAGGGESSNDLRRRRLSLQGKR